MTLSRTLTGLGALAAALLAAAPVGAEVRRVSVPVDRADPSAGRLSVAFERSRATGRRRGTVVVLAGGPGESATALHRSTLADLGPAVRRSRDVVSVDARGTGLSGVVACPGLQRDPRTRSTAGAEACAARLGARRGAYTVREQVEDLEAVRRALGTRRIDLLGTSYGTRVALRYAQAHPTRVGRLVLDSVVRPEGPSPVGQEIFGALPRVLDEVCAAARCRRYLGDPTAETAALVASLRAAPLGAAVPDARGRQRRRSVDGVALLDLLLAGDFSQALRDALPAAIAGARRGDPAPLVRLHRLAVASVPPLALRRFSVGAYAAGSCEDLPLPWDPAADPAARAAQAAERLRAQGDAAFRPFDAQSVLDADFLALCLRWPAPRVAPDPAAQAAAPLPGVPMLLLSGAEDLRTPVEDARAVAERAPRGRLLVVPRVGHAVIGSDTSGCARAAARAFLRRTGGPRRCRAPERVGPTVPVAPGSAAGLRPVRGVAGRAGRTIRALDLTFDDVALALAIGPARGGGLRGGAYDVRGGRLRLRAYEYVPGVAISARPAAGGGLRVRITGAGAARGSVTVSRFGGVRGTLGATRVRATLGAGPPEGNAGP